MKFSLDFIEFHYKKILLLNDTIESLDLNIKRLHVGFAGENINCKIYIAEGTYIISNPSYFGVQGITKLGIAVVDNKTYVVMYYNTNTRSAYEIYFNHDSKRIKQCVGNVDSASVVYETAITRAT